MIILHRIDDVRNTLQTSRKQNKSIGLVPTMGALHEGHLSLIRRCREENDIAVVSVFVNPTQFNNKQDLATYPRNLEKDAKLLDWADVDVVFAPEPEDVYTSEDLSKTFSFDFQGLDKVMEGKQRPGHFNGVVQIVSKLFSIVEPCRAYFGLKDFQQVAIIRLMVREMHFPVEIIPCPIVREESGLARSSRNQLLSREQKIQAANIYRILRESLARIDSSTPEELTEWTVGEINAQAGLDVEYYEIVNGDTLQKITSWDDATYVVGCVTVHCGSVRLIDNIRLK